jgi:Inner membrane component of T3SS, cytoplasmic domain
MTDRRRLVITDDDVAPQPGPQAPPSHQGPAPLPSIQGVRPQPYSIGAKTAAASPFGSTLVQTLVASVVGAFAGWAATKLFAPDPNLLHVVRSEAEFFAVFGAGYAAVFAAWEALTSRLWEEALRTAAIGGAIGALGGALSGAIAQEVYGRITKNIAESAGFGVDPTDVRLNAARALGWAILGVGIGAALGAAKRSSRKLVNGLIGGAVGGAIGGFLFNYVGEASKSNDTTQIVTTAITGAAIGVAIGLVEVARRQAWLRVTGGGMTGKEFIIYHAVTNVGSSPKAEITLIKDPAIAPLHVRIEDRGNGRMLSALDGMYATVNGEPVGTRRLRNGDALQLGNTTLAYQEKELAR